jgi:ATP-dependent DNA ligase
MWATPFSTVSFAADETGRPQFYDLLRDTRGPAYVAFDLIWLNGADLRALPLSERRRHLQNILPEGSSIISEALSVTGEGHKLFELMCAHDLEGIVAKRLKDAYGPRTRWLKIKNRSYSQNAGRQELFDGSRRPGGDVSDHCPGGVHDQSGAGLLVAGHSGRDRFLTGCIR